MIKKFLFFCFLTSVVISASAEIYAWPQTGCDTIGQLQVVDLGFFDTIAKIDMKYDVGFDSMQEANPGYHIKDLHNGESLLIPTRFILPKAPRKGVVLNLPEMRIYYFDTNSHIVLSYPVGIGKIGAATPLGKTRIVKKVVDPTWTPTTSVKKGFIKKYGFALPDQFPPGPENPLGNYAMRLGFTNILIHGTNDPAGVGKRVSAGCIRMQNANVGELFQFVWVGMPVLIVDQPYKAAWQGKQLLLEAHRPTGQKEGQFIGGYKKVIQQALDNAPSGKVTINWKLAKQVAHLQLGVPEIIGGIDMPLPHHRKNKKVEKLASAK